MKELMINYLTSLDLEHFKVGLIEFLARESLPDLDWIIDTEKIEGSLALYHRWNECNLTFPQSRGN